MNDNKTRTGKSVEGLQHWFEEILEASFDGILVTDRNGVCIFINDSYTRNTGIEKEEILGRNLRELINPDWMPRSTAIEAIETKEIVTIEYDTKNGKHIIVTGKPIFDKEQNVIRTVVNTRDISEIKALKLELDEAKAMEQMYLERLNTENGYASINNETVVINSKMRDIYDVAKRVSSYNTTVLITGESGTGKELVARYIHEQDFFRKDNPFIVINCGAIPENLLESELFGYVEGAFTGALKGGKKGLFEEADTGTIFLDEIGELPLSLQVKLLRVLESRKVQRIGSAQEKEIDMRVIAATNRNLEKEVKEGKFRDDLYYRLNVVNLDVPPLRERIDEILPLATQFAKTYNKIYGQNKKLTIDLVREMENYQWPGNIRELKNTVEHMVVISRNSYLYSTDLPWLKETKPILQEELPLRQIMEEFEKSVLERAKEKYKTTEAIGKALEVDQSTVSRKLRKYHID